MSLAKPFTLRPAIPADIPACASTAAAAFADSPLIRVIGPSSEEHTLAFWTAVAASAFDDPNAHLIVAEDTSTSPASLLGFAKWVYVPAGSPPPNILDAGVAFASQATDGGEGGRIWAQTADPALAERFFREQNERHVKYMGQREHWYLEVICTRPEGKGKGVGSGLLTWGVDRADANGCEAYLEASPEGRPLFEKFGWRVLERLEYLDGGYVECSMVRDAALGRGC